MTVERDNSRGDDRRFTERAACRVCGRPYLLPKGQAPMPSGVGPCCQLDLLGQAWLAVQEPPEQPEREQADERVPARELGHLGLQDVLCEACRGRLAEGRLYPPGVALCTGCADEALGHWLAWLQDPTHDWWPSDDPFASARHAVDGWRDMEPA